MTAPVAVSLDLLDALHNHGELSVDVMLQIYGWHGEAPYGAYHGAQGKGGVVGGVRLHRPI